MMVTFVSQCEKNALSKTRRVLDAFANRIGDNTWQTLITEEGLLTVKKMLRQTASRSSAVSCHWIRSRSRSQFLWVVGNKKKFSSDGYVPVNYTEKDLLNSDYESDWKYLPLIKALAGIAALLHDWGKASLLFQEKLNPEKKPKHKGDPLRHEWVSCLLFHQWISCQDHERLDEVWLNSMIEKGIDETCFHGNTLLRDKALAELPTAAGLIAWLIVSHHRLPLPKEAGLCNDQREVGNASLEELLARITPAWGYENRFDEYNALLPKCFEFPLGLLSNSPIWLTELKRRAKDLLHHLPLLEQSMNDGSWRGLLHHARLCLMLGDHYYSSQPNDHQWKTSIELYANTDPTTKARKQKLDEHLVNVAKVAVNTVKLLPFFESEPLKATELRELAPKANTPKAFRWQDKAVRKINAWREHTEDKTQGYFVVNMASTGCGKTIANAKIMQALSEDGESLRFILALGLRTLTLQTGDEYKERLKLQESDLAVLIGSKAISELHKSGKKVEIEDIEPEHADDGSESLESLQDENDVLDWQGVLPEEELTTVLTKQKDRQLLYAPVLVCTIDHIMAATETKRGGRYILPCLRLMSSDLVIDEIDDFTGDDLIAIGRLVHLAGMLGRKVMISSATIPPDLALGLYNAYRQGWVVFAASRDRVSSINCVYVDEFSADVQMVGCEDPDLVAYEAFQQSFVSKRADKLKQQISRRKADIIQCIKLNEQPLDKQYFNTVKQAVLAKHLLHNTLEPESQIWVSFGVVRVANIQPCVELTQYLLGCDWPADTEVRCMAYHSQQVMLLRHEQEKHLDEVLKRKEKPGELPIAFAHPVIREHLSVCTAKNLIFILVATPVEEVGRDHDFDWAVIEPSSFRSIIQMAGRVRRHRDGQILEPNIGLLQYNIKGFRGGEERVFNYPGYETDKATQLVTHDLCDLVDEKSLLQSVNAIVRIQKRATLEPHNNLADLEHYATAKTLGTDQIGKPQQTNISRQDRHNSRNRRNSSPQSFWSEHLHGHIHGYWWLTALPQYFKRFRKSEPTVQIYLVKKERGIEFCLREEQGGLHPIERTLNIEHVPLAPAQQQKLWLQRDYSQLVRLYSPIAEKEFATSVRYGEISFIYREGNQQYSYNDQLGLVKVK
ncbi:MAG: type I-F CRISPR-associated helicase Cas3f [Shewanella sp.]|uniref:type I-F CRISPR-associated helicase Cas3f n=1 Tax=Plesiomonas shigelloides TaxID=703 RepID=UPI0012622C54|nr:type I-F CRISPR-associated helicase Cas3f [Plesiomonas shigelloides]KAB7658659.1 type I-F CRISPR-associated helicase Cas3 [Plesiomonas shigelloides]